MEANFFVGPDGELYPWRFDAAVPWSYTQDGLCFIIDFPQKGRVWRYRHDIIPKSHLAWQLVSGSED